MFESSVILQFYNPLTLGRCFPPDGDRLKFCVPLNGATEVLAIPLRDFFPRTHLCADLWPLYDFFFFHFLPSAKPPMGINDTSFLESLRPSQKFDPFHY